MQIREQEEIYKAHRHMIYMKIYKGRRYVFQPEISRELGISRVTMTEHLAALEEDGLIYRNSVFFYTYRDGMGPRPVLWSTDDKYRIAVGVEISEHTAEITAINLYGDSLKCETFRADYENSGEYYGKIADKVKEFIDSLEIDDADKKILGIGFAFQGITSEDGAKVTYGELLKCIGLKIDVFAERLNYPCRFVNATSCAALCELWRTPKLKSLFYLSMSEHLNGAFVMADDILQAAKVCQSMFEHITACENGGLCYCGKHGCYETVCSKVALLKGEKPEEFFQRVRSGESKESERWQNFLSHLGRLIASLHLVYDTNYILGGHLAPYFTESDIDTLYEIVRERTPFAEGKDYILLSKMPSHNITIGAALPYIINFLDKLPDVKP